MSPDTMIEKPMVSDTCPPEEHPGKEVATELISAEEMSVGQRWKAGACPDRSRRATEWEYPGEGNGQDHRECADAATISSGDCRGRDE